jgi:hypothetical protein
MSKFSDEFYKKTYTISAEDPYLITIKLMEHLHRYGNVVEKLNILTAGETDKASKVDFLLEHKFDKFTKLIFLFQTRGDIKNKRLNITIMGMHQMHLPLIGPAEDTFNLWYLQEAYPQIYASVKKTAKMIIKDTEKTIKGFELTPKN